MAYQHFFSGLLSNHTADISKISCTHLADRMQEIKTKTRALIQQNPRGEKQLFMFWCKLIMSYFPIPSLSMAF